MCIHDSFKKDTVLCFSRPIWMISFKDFESVNNALRREITALDWDELEQETRLRYPSNHTFLEDRFVTLEQVPAFRSILDLFLLQCTAIIERMNWDIAGQKLGVHDFWIHLTKPGEVTEAHRHTPAAFSGAYYIDVPPDCGNIVFLDDYPHGPYEPDRKAGMSNYLGGQHIEFAAKEGSMVIFPGWMNHKVTRNQSGRRRLSLSFNAILANSP